MRTPSGATILCRRAECTRWSARGGLAVSAAGFAAPMTFAVKKRIAKFMAAGFLPSNKLGGRAVQVLARELGRSNAHVPVRGLVWAEFAPANRLFVQGIHAGEE